MGGSRVRTKHSYGNSNLGRKQRKPRNRGGKKKGTPKKAKPKQKPKKPPTTPLVSDPAAKAKKAASTSAANDLYKKVYPKHAFILSEDHTENWQADGRGFHTPQPPRDAAGSSSSPRRRPHTANPTYAFSRRTLELVDHADPTGRGHCEATLCGETQTFARRPGTAPPKPEDEMGRSHAYFNTPLLEGSARDMQAPGADVARYAVPATSASYPLRSAFLDGDASNLPAKHATGSAYRHALRSGKINKPHVSFDIDGDGTVSVVDMRVAKRFDKDASGTLDAREQADGRHVLAREFLARHARSHRRELARARRKARQRREAAARAQRSSAEFSSIGELLQQRHLAAYKRRERRRKKKKGGGGGGGGKRVSIEGAKGEHTAAATAIQAAVRGRQARSPTNQRKKDAAGGDGDVGDGASSAGGASSEAGGGGGAFILNGGEHHPGDSLFLVCPELHRSPRKDRVHALASGLGGDFQKNFNKLAVKERGILQNASRGVEAAVNPQQQRRRRRGRGSRPHTSHASNRHGRGGRGGRGRSDRFPFEGERTAAQQHFPQSPRLKNSRFHRMLQQELKVTQPVRRPHTSHASNRGRSAGGGPGGGGDRSATGGGGGETSRSAPPERPHTAAETHFPGSPRLANSLFHRRLAERARTSSPPAARRQRVNADVIKRLPADRRPLTDADDPRVRSPTQPRPNTAVGHLLQTPEAWAPSRRVAAATGRAVGASAAASDRPCRTRSELLLVRREENLALGSAYEKKRSDLSPKYDHAVRALISKFGPTLRPTDDIF